MDEKKPCARCDRPIDPYARICPYCNWDQTSTAPPPAQQPPSATAGYTPPQERNWRRHALFIGGGILVLVASFFVGALINSDDTPENAPTPVTDEIGQQENVARTRRADVTLVPVSDGGMPSELPITSAPIANPAEGVPTEYQRSDATAVSSVEYAALAQRAEAERKAQQRMVDPRSITGPAYAQGTPRPPRSPAVPPPMTSGAQESLSDRASDREVDARNRPPARVVERTRPVPQSQPIPNISVTEPVTARLELTIGADGRVTAVRIKKSIPGKTAELIGAVQRWRFKPATENGVPVSAPFNVDISFNP